MSIALNMSEIKVYIENIETTRTSVLVSIYKLILGIRICIIFHNNVTYNFKHISTTNVAWKKKGNATYLLTLHTCTLVTTVLLTFLSIMILMSLTHLHRSNAILLLLLNGRADLFNFINNLKNNSSIVIKFNYIITRCQINSEHFFLKLANTGLQIFTIFSF